MCLSAMHLKFPVAAELVATSYSLPAGNREKKATTHVFFKKKKKEKNWKKGGKSSQAQVFTCASCRARGVWQSPPAIQQGAVGCTEPLAECRWQLLGFYSPLGCWCGHSKAWSRCCHAKPQLCQ